MADIIRERFSKPADEFAAKFVASIEADANLVVEDIKGSIAHAKMLKHQHILTEQEVIGIVAGLEHILKDWEEGKFTLNVASEDVHMNIEKRLIDFVPTVGAKLHTARSRNDQVALDLRLWTWAVSAEIVKSIHDLQKSLAIRAKQHAETIFPGITHLQHAQPIVFGHVLLCYHDRLGRDAGRFEDSLKRTTVSPLGACAMAGTSFSTDPAFTAKEIGLSGAFTNSIDAVSDRDFAAEFAAACSILMVHLSQIAEDMIYWSTPEFGFVELPDELCTSSSIMPQKKNPDVAELVRGKTGRLYGNLVAVLTTMKGLPLAYNSDMQEDKEPFFDSVDTLEAILGVLPPLLTSLTFRTDRMRAAAGEHYATATDLADYLVRKGLPFRQAHEIVGKAVRHALERGVGLEALPLDTLRGFSPLIEADVRDALTVEASLRARAVTGGTAPAAVATALAEARALVRS